MPLKIAPCGPEKYFTSQNEAYAYDLLLHVVPQDNSSTFFFNPFQQHENVWAGTNRSIMTCLCGIDKHLFLWICGVTKL